MFAETCRKIYSQGTSNEYYLCKVGIISVSVGAIGYVGIYFDNKIGGCGVYPSGVSRCIW